MKSHILERSVNVKPSSRDLIASIQARKEEKSVKCLSMNSNLAVGGIVAR